MSGKLKKDISSEEYFLSGRNLKWPSIAISTIATNIQGMQYMGFMGSAYLYGLAQANMEINAIQGILMAAFIFVPLYLKERVITVTQFIEKRLGSEVSLAYSVANIALFSTLGLGAALFWGAYAADMVFGEYFLFISDIQTTRIAALILGLGVFSAIYTFYGGLSAVVRTDIIQFSILLIGGSILLLVSINELGGWGELYNKVPEKMHLHLPADHPKLPWIALGGMFLLNINYWCANQVVLQRSLAAKSLRHAQVGLMVGGVMKYFMALIIIVPGIALYGLLGKDGLADPDEAFPYLVRNFLSPGFRGIILCALFASLMSTVDSLFNSLSTLFSVDIYKRHLRPEATDSEMVQMGRRTILVTLCTGVMMGLVLMWIKFGDQGEAFTHTLNDLRYFVNCGIVVLICTAVFLKVPRHRFALAAFLLTVPLNLLLRKIFPDMNYFVRAMWVILIAFSSLGIPAIFGKQWRGASEWLKSSDRSATRFAIVLAVSLVLSHLLFH